MSDTTTPEVETPEMVWNNVWCENILLAQKVIHEFRTAGVKTSGPFPAKSGWTVGYFALAEKVDTVFVHAPKAKDESVPASTTGEKSEGSEPY